MTAQDTTHLLNAQGRSSVRAAFTSLRSCTRSGLITARACAFVDPFAASAGRAVVLVFVRTDCPISNRYAPLLQKLSEKFHAKANFWLVYPDRAEAGAQIKAHLQDYHYSIPALRDVRHALVKRSQATITPEAAVFDSSGRLLYHGRIDNWYEDFGRSRPAATTHELDDAIAAATVVGRVVVDGRIDVAGLSAAGRYSRWLRHRLPAGQGLRHALAVYSVPDTGHRGGLGAAHPPIDAGFAR